MVGLGPAGPEHLDPDARALLTGACRAFLRTTRHPAVAGELGLLPSFDHLYEAAATFDEVYGRIVAALVAAAEAAAREGEAVVYGVPGSPLVAERTVELLRREPAVSVEVRPARSFLDLAWERLGVDPLAAGVRLVDGTRFALEAAGERGPLLVAQCWSRDVLSAIKLSVDDEAAPGHGAVTVLHHLGLPDEVVTEVPWWELDRTLEPDHLTSLWVPRLAAPIAGEVAALAELARTLRERCPWDREQTHASLARHLLEESYEALDAIERLGRAEEAGALDDAVDHLREELGDVLFQVVLHATLAAEEGRFTLADVARGIHDKLVGRHPHVFGDVVAETPDAVAANWDRLKAAEKGRTSVTEGVPTALPALALAAALQRKAESAGIEAGVPAAGGWSPAEADRVLDGLLAGATERVGPLLLRAVAAARRLGVDAEEALRQAALDLRDRIVDAEAARRGPGLPPASFGRR